VVYLPASVLILIGLLARTVRQSVEAGIVGLIAFLVAFFGTVLLIGIAWAQFFIGTFLAIDAQRSCFGTSGVPDNVRHPSTRLNPIKHSYIARTRLSKVGCRATDSWRW
jgi:hypothetical protein